MQINAKRGEITISLTKGETGWLLGAAGIAENIARNKPESEDAKHVMNAARALAKLYGAKHFDEKGAFTGK